MPTLDGISVLVSNYVEQRDAFRARFQNTGTGLVALNSNAIGEFDDLVNGFAEMLARMLPEGMTLAQWEALAELTNSHLNEMRRRLQ